MTNHTPTPWQTGEVSWNEEGDVRYTLHGIKVAHAGDAHLIGAAPEILKNLQSSHAMLFMLWEIETNLVRRQALADQLSLNTIAISKAKGE